MGTDDKSKEASYWRRVAGQALKDTIAIMGWGSPARLLVNTVIPVAVLVALIVWAPEGLATLGAEEAVVRTALVAGSLFAFPILYVVVLARIPSRLDGEWRARVATQDGVIASLEARFEPRLVVTHGNDKIWRTEGGKQNRWITQLRLGLRNDSDAEVTGVILRIANLTNVNTGDQIQLNHNLLPGGRNVGRTDIIGRDNEYYKAFEVHQDARNRGLVIETFVGPFDGVPAQSIGPGPYRVKLRVGSSGTPAQNFYFHFEIGAEGQIAFDPED